MGAGRYALPLLGGPARSRSRGCRWRKAWRLGGGVDSWIQLLSASTYRWWLQLTWTPANWPNSQPSHEPGCQQMDLQKERGICCGSVILTIHSVCPFPLGNLLRAPGLNSDCAYERGDRARGTVGWSGCLEGYRSGSWRCPPPLQENTHDGVPGGHLPLGGSSVVNFFLAYPLETSAQVTLNLHFFFRYNWMVVLEIQVKWLLCDLRLNLLLRFKVFAKPSSQSVTDHDLGWDTLYIRLCLWNSEYHR